MHNFRVALAQVNPTVGDLKGNARRVRSYIQKAKRAGADLVAFPELVLTGYPPEDLLLKPSFTRLQSYPGWNWLNQKRLLGRILLQVCRQVLSMAMWD